MKIFNVFKKIFKQKNDIKFIKGGFVNKNDLNNILPRYNDNFEKWRNELFKQIVKNIANNLDNEIMQEHIELELKNNIICNKNFSKYI